MLRVLLILAACAAWPARAGADAGADAGDAVSQIVVEGNSRTSRDVILRALDVRPGDRVADDALPALRQRVYNLRVFQSVELEKRPSDAGHVLAVTVKERWTLIPIPIVGASEGSTFGGLVLSESNLLGRQKQLALMGVFSSRGQTALVMYRDPALFGTRAVLTAEVVAENEKRERADRFDVIDAWRDRRFEASVRPGLRLTDRLSLRAGPFVLLRESRTEDAYAPPPKAGNDFGIVADLDYAGQDYRDWFEAGPFFRARFRESLPDLGSDRRFVQANAEGAWSIQGFRDHAASVSVSGHLVDGDPVLDAFALGGRPGTRGLRSGGLWVERALTATVDYQVPLWRPGWGTVTGLGFVDSGVSRWRGEDTRWVAPGAGFRLYVRNVAFPALGMDLAWSTEGESLAASFFLGFGN